MLKTTLLLAGLTALFMTVGYLLGGESGMWLAFLLALATNAFTYWFSDSVVLKMYRATPLSPERNPGLYAIIARLSRNAGIPIPKAYLIDTEQPNAFATGRSPQHAAIAVTTGLTRLLNEEELAGVLAHELAHIKNRDTLIMTVTATLAGAIGMLANFAFFFGGRGNDRQLGPLGGIVIALLAPLMAMLVQLAISRTREYAADKTGAEIAAAPASLASALKKISEGTRRIPNPLAEAYPGTAHLFISNPLGQHRRDNLFSTHPSPENRIRLLMDMASRVRTGLRVEEAHTPINRHGTFDF